ncbi:uncharacterized protein TRAVEDRAFT_53483 [Trametes versicolor FP-101664 SS1]|uniref:uncharacterized protein n=1 Tax=Trametes versicolor (strain FP-101664) TaxID=717944 RepID=UPI0004622254|nr:uncharacterized protein TRAVEDRAFT_53483 [Trametes versicolor FP-101664 SS1]EIW53068.1 hypothetical protein TRAVEDRAFT_53483 [Trametes versicolor FP-101664 SS1]
MLVRLGTRTLTCPNCEVDNTGTVALHSKVLGSRIPLIAGDALVLAVTQRKTYYRLKKAADAAHMKTSKAELLLRNGTIYSGLMLVLNVLQILIAFVEQVAFMGDIVDIRSRSLNSNLVSRFLINLRALDAQ